VTIIQGAIFVVCVLTFRRGVVGEIMHLMRRRAAPAEAVPARAERPAAGE
jgi:branched-chain amino acid transport system permease protein